MEVIRMLFDLLLGRKPEQSSQVRKDLERPLPKHFPFMLLPVELRQEVYRRLFLQPKNEVNLYHLHSIDTLVRGCRCMCDRLSQADIWLDSLEEDDDNGDGSDSTESDSEDDNSDESDRKSDRESDSDEFDILPLNILRVNRQIYFEASHILYTEVTMVLTENDILSLGDIPTTLRDAFEKGLAKISPQILAQNNLNAHESGRNTIEVEPQVKSGNIFPMACNIWTNNPLECTGPLNDKSLMTYSGSSETTGGTLEPYRFARFEKIKIIADFSAYYVEPRDFDLWIDDDTLKLDQATAAEYQDYMKRSQLIKRFAKILSNSRHLRKLSFVLREDTIVLVDSLAISQESEMDGLSADEQAEVRRISCRSQNAAGKLAVGLILDSNIFHPLLKLDNVENIDFQVELVDPEIDEYLAYKQCRPLPDDVNKLEKMKVEIEGNFARRQHLRSFLRGVKTATKLRKAKLRQ